MSVQLWESPTRAACRLVVGGCQAFEGKNKGLPRIKNPHKFLATCALSAITLIAATVIAIPAHHLLRANDGINPFPVEGKRFEGNLGPVNVLVKGEFSEYVPFSKSLKVMRDAFDATPIDPHQVQMNARAYFSSRTDTHQNANGCVILSYARPTNDSKVYISVSNPNSPTIMNRDLLDFVIPAHELNHCLYNVEDGFNISKMSDFDGDYFSSVMETAGDLGATLLYAQKTGTFDAFENMLRLERRTNLYEKGHDHTTVWAMDVLLKDVDPQAMTRKSVPEIAQIVRFLMAKHYESNGFLRNPSVPGTEVTPAMQAIQDEITAQKWIVNERKVSGCATPGVDSLVTQLRADIRQSLANNQDRYAVDLTDAERRVIARRRLKFADQVGIAYRTPEASKKVGQGYQVSARDLPF